MAESSTTEAGAGPTRRQTLESVARHAAVSRQTVSNVLNSPHLVRPETLQRVQAAIAELDYRPLLAARQLRTRRSRIIGLRLPQVTNGINGAVLDTFLHALTEEAQLGGYRVMLFTATDDTDEVARYSELLATTSIDGFVLTGTHHGDPRTAWLAVHEVPFVTFGRPWSDRPAGHSWVDVDNAAGTRAATEHLLALGHRRIGFLGCPADRGVSDERRAGWRSTLAAAGLPPAPELDIASTDEVSEGVVGARRLLAAADPPTAIVCASDSLAIGARSALPAVTGFDDTPVAAALGITSVAQPLVEAARECFVLLRHHVERPHGDGASPPAEHRMLAPRLVVRPQPSVDR
ncbi:MAG: LacI family transcriptional regulator [Pseudonocardia sp.]|nr:LacI family transcriptional regulator [Pseudonocardia sp.]